MGQIKTIIDREKQILINTVTGNPTADDYKKAIKSKIDGIPTKYAVCKWGRWFQNDLTV